MTDDELKQLFDVMRLENTAAHAETRKEVVAMRQEIVEVRQDNAAMRQENVAAHEETRRHFDVAVEGMKHEIGIIAEKVPRLDEKLDRRTDELEEKMDRRFADTEALIEYSHKKLERRVAVLEESS